mmetsp:Transcript_1096/g.1188  ORF Transcript_1096/g.1188 Transcript_1096/m.1188 type:complete len:160 (+) Transcript_1096:63-542(+)
MRRSSRRQRSEKKRVDIPASLKVGLISLVTGNERLVANMLDFELDEGKDTSAAVEILVSKLGDCLQVNNLNAEGLLARFFDSEVLSKYCIEVLGKSGKGKEPVLAARIAREWAKPGFEHSEPLLKKSNKRKESRNNENDDKHSGVESESSPAKKKKTQQ